MSSPRTRRHFLQELLAGCGACAVVPHGFAAGTDERRLILRNTHTGDVLDTIYRTGNQLRPVELGRLDWIFRDHRAASVRAIDARLFELLHELAASAGAEPRYEIISGYRSPATNAKLAATSGGVSSQSLHMEGKAIDIRLTGVALARLRDLALARRAGGVGYYPGSDFVHLDVGRVRSWSG